jgi:protein SCO1/2
MGRSVFFPLIILVFLGNIIFISQGLSTETKMEHTKDDSMNKHMTMDHEKAVETEIDLSKKVRVDEKLGEIIDMDTWFYDENGDKVNLTKFFDKPVVILPIYFFCPTVCSFLQADLAKVLNQIEQAPGKDFNVISLMMI